MSDIRDGMRIEWDVEIPMDDGISLRADVYRPIPEGRYPVLLSAGPYAKGLSFQEGYPTQWEHMVQNHPDVTAGSTNRYQAWEVPDPEKWVPDGYVLVRADSRGTGRSPGVMDLWSARESRDLYDCIEWAGTRPWSNGKVGLAGVSYFAMNQYQVAALQPPHLAAICPWEGASDWHREFARHGGILSQFAADWYPRQVTMVQHGVGKRGHKNSITGTWVAGPETLPDEELASNRRELPGELARRRLIDEWYLERNPDWSRVTVPMLSAANWGGHGLHTRGNFEAFTQAASRQKWLEVHGLAHWVLFYTDYGVELQKRFFGQFLKGEDTGWQDRPPVQLQVRRIDGTFIQRTENEWPLARTQWTRLYLDGSTCSLKAQPAPTASAVSYDPRDDGITFSTPPLEEEIEVTGPLAARLFVSSETTDADLFLVVRVFDHHDDEVTFIGALDPNTPVAQGWLRASQRKLDPARSLPYRPYHAHDERQPLEPGTIYHLDVEIWPTCVVIPSGYRLALTVRGKDYEYDGELSQFARTFHYAGRGVGPFKHDDPVDRPEDVYGGRVTLYSGGVYEPYLLVPIVPPAR